MNCSIYIFRELSSIYSQYPEDDYADIFKSVKSQCLAPSQLIIHRDKNLMHYVYVRKFNQQNYFGFGITINGYYLTQLQPLFSLFEKEIEYLSENGIIIELNTKGDISLNISSFNSQEEEVISVINRIHKTIIEFKEIERLPPIDYSFSIISQKIFKDSDSISDIVNASYSFGFTIILKENDYDTIRLTSFKNLLKNLNSTNNRLLKENEELRKSNQKIKRQKKQFKNIITLFIALIICGIGLYTLYVTLNDTQDKLYIANDTISTQKALIEHNDSLISRLKYHINNLENNLRVETKAKEKAENSLQTICSEIPFTITSCEVNANQFKFDYFCPKEKEINITLKVINEYTREITTTTHTLNYNQGIGSQSLNFTRRLNTSQFYYIMIMYENRIVTGMRW